MNRSTTGGTGADTVAVVVVAMSTRIIHRGSGADHGKGGREEMIEIVVDTTHVMKEEEVGETSGTNWERREGELVVIATSRGPTLLVVISREGCPNRSSGTSRGCSQTGLSLLGNHSSPTFIAAGRTMTVTAARPPP